MTGGDVVDEQPDVLSLGSDRFRRRPATLLVIGVIAACLAVLGWSSTVLGQRDQTIAALRHALRVAGRAPGRTAQAPAPGYAGSRFLRFPDGPGGQFSMVAVAIRPGPSAAATTWVFVTGRGVTPGRRYALLGGLCGGQFVTSADLAEATANRAGDLTLAATDVDVSPVDPRAWILVYAERDGTTLGGIQGPFTAAGARPFRLTPPCQRL